MLAPLQIIALPLIVAVGFTFTVTVFVQTLEHPFLLTLSRSVKEPDAPAVTFTVAPVVEPTIDPFPLIVHVCVRTPPAGVTVDVYALFIEVPQTASAPVIVQVGVALTVMFTDTHAGVVHPVVVVAVTQ